MGGEEERVHKTIGRGCGRQVVGGGEGEEEGMLTGGGGRVWCLGPGPTVASPPPLPPGASLFAFLMGTMANIASPSAVTPPMHSPPCVVTPTGASMFAFLMGTMANIVSNMDSVTARVLRKRGAVDEFLRQRNVPR